MCACSDELKNVSFDSVDEKPVGLDVTLPAVSKRTFELVIPVLWQQRLTLNQGFDDRPQVASRFTSLLNQFDVAPKLACR